MFDLKRKSLFIQAKLGMAVTIMVLTSACAHEILVRPANNDSAGQELSQVTPEPQAPAQLSPVSGGEKKHRKSGKHTVAKRPHKAKKSATVARHKVKAHKAHIPAQAAASVKDITPPPPSAPPAPEIAPPSVPAPIASAAVQTEIESDSSSRIGQFAIYGLAALAVLGLIFVAPRARRISKPKRKLVFNG